MWTLPVALYPAELSDGPGEPVGHRDHAAPSALRRVHDVMPDLPLDVELPLVPLGVERGQRPDLARAQPSVPAQQDDGPDTKVELDGGIHEASQLLVRLERRGLGVVDLGEIEGLDRHRVDDLQPRKAV